MRTFRRIMLGSGFDIDSLPDTQKLYYTATAKVEPLKGSLGATIIYNEWDSITNKGVIVCNGDITTISAEAFFGCHSLTSITIPEKVTSIGASAFSGCTSLTSITIPNIVTEVGTYAFAYCNSLASATIGNGVTSIGNKTFYECRSLTSVTIPDSVTSIGEMAFKGCTSLNSITIPDRVTSIGTSAFSYCNYLSRVDIKDLTAWCKINFHAPIANNSTLAFNNGNPLCNGAELYLNGERVTELVIPSSITIIEGGVFEGCTSITKVTIPNTATRIGQKAFKSCVNLTSVTLGNSIANIQKEVFMKCSSLISITLPESVTLIEDGVFSYCSALTAFYGKWASEDNKYLIISNKLKACACSNLTICTVPEGVTEISDSVFVQSNITSVTIPGTVSKIGKSAFAHCSQLVSVYCKASTPPYINSSTFTYNANERKIYVPLSSVGAYKTTMWWDDLADSIVGYDFNQA